MENRGRRPSSNSPQERSALAHGRPRRYSNSIRDRFRFEQEALPISSPACFIRTSTRSWWWASIHRPARLDLVDDPEKAAGHRRPAPAAAPLSTMPSTTPARQAWPGPAQTRFPPRYRHPSDGDDNQAAIPAIRPWNARRKTTSSSTPSRRTSPALKAMATRS